MQKINFLEHTADVKFEAYGKTLEEAFENAALTESKLGNHPAAAEYFKLAHLQEDTAVDAEP